MERLTGPWKLADLKPVNGPRVFSCFHCGGGSTMGYKLAGFNVIGGVEIDPKMMELYRRNHKPDPKLSFLMPIQDFIKLPKSKIPKELFNLDILDGSPPCSSFSMSGSREEKWGVEKKFKEGQAEQVLDDLFFHFIKAAKMLRPKMVIAENVKGLIIGNARWYVSQIFKKFEEAGYDCQLYLLNSAYMGVPQARERTFFIARRKDLKIPNLCLNFNEPIISVSKAIKGVGGKRRQLSPAFAKWWKLTVPGKAFSSSHSKGSFFNSMKLHPNHPAPTVTATRASCISHWDKPEHLSNEELVQLQTFPVDYDFNGLEAQYVLGMSVPPFMMQRLALECRKALLSIGSS